MRRFLVMCVLFAVLVIMPFAAAYIFRPLNAQIDLATLPHKYGLVDSVPAPRIIFVGGSNLSFGLNSKRISDSLHIAVINTGVHAGLGLKFQLNTIIPRLKRGDVIVIMPELSNFFGGINGDKTGVLSLAAICTSLQELKHLNVKQMGKVIGGFGLSLKYYYASLNENDGMHNVNAYNYFGDNERHWADTTKYVINFGKPRNVPVDNEAVEWLSSQIIDLREEGYKVILFPATIVETEYRNKSKQITKCFKAMSEAGVPFMVGERAHVMPDEYVYDTPNHLNKAGVDSLTTILIQELRSLGIGRDEM